MYTDSPVNVHGLPRKCSRTPPYMYTDSPVNVYAKNDKVL